MLSVWVNMLANIIIQTYFQNCNCLLILKDWDSYYDYWGPIPTVKVAILNGTVDYNLLFKYYGCQGIVISSKEPKLMFQGFEQQIRLNVERFNRRRYLIIPMPTDNQTDFFDQKALDFVADLLLVNPQIITHDNLDPTKKIESTFDLITHKYVGTTKNNEPVILDKWFSANRSFLLKANLYPNKINNQQGRALKIATFTYEPYTIVGNSAAEMHGSELQLAVHYAQFHNMTADMVVNDLDYWGDIFENGSSNGLLGNLVTDRADIGVGALYTWEFCYYHLDLSKPTVRTGITCLVPSPKLAAGWFTPLFSYSPDMWMWVGFTFLISVVVLSFNLIYYRKNGYVGYVAGIVGSALLQIYKPLMLQSLVKGEMSSEISTKFLTGLMLVFSLFFTTTYSSGLSSIMTVPRYDNAINTVKEFARRGLDWGATQEAWIMSIEKSNEPDYVKIVNKFKALSEHELRQHSKTETFAFSIERLPFENFAIGSYLEKDVIGNFHLMQEDLYWEQCVIMTRKNSILLPSLDDFILRVFEIGIISRWQNRAVYLYMDSYVQRMVKYYTHHANANSHEVVKLKWIHVEGAFAALLLGHGVSFLVFLTELCYRNIGINLGIY